MIKWISSLLIFLLSVIPACSGGRGSSESAAVSSQLANKINTSGVEDVPFISRDGNKLYFHYSIYKFSDLKIGIKTIIGPLRPGHSLEDFENRYFLGYVSEKINSTWTTPVPINFADQELTATWGSVDISSDGNFMYTIGPGTPGESDIFVHELLGGVWSNPTKVVGINTGYIEDDPDIAKDNTLLVWDSDRPGGFGMRDIWYSDKLPDGTWTAPQNIGVQVNSVNNEQYPFLSEDGSRLYFNRAIPSEMAQGRIHIFMSENSGGVWSAPVELDLGIDVALSPSLTADESIMYFEVGTITNNDPNTLFEGNIDIYYSVKQPDGSWSIAQPVD